MPTIHRVKEVIHLYKEMKSIVWFMVVCRVKSLEFATMNKRRSISLAN
jgi:hypothetical protein